MKLPTRIAALTAVLPFGAPLDSLTADIDYKGPPDGVPPALPSGTGLDGQGVLTLKVRGVTPERLPDVLELLTGQRPFAAHAGRLVEARLGWTQGEPHPAMSHIAEGAPVVMARLDGVAGQLWSPLGDLLRVVQGLPFPADNPNGTLHRQDAILELERDHPDSLPLVRAYLERPALLEAVQRGDDEVARLRTELGNVKDEAVALQGQLNALPEAGGADAADDSQAARDRDAYRGQVEDLTRQLSQAGEDRVRREAELQTALETARARNQELAAEAARVRAEGQSNMTDLEAALEASRAETATAQAALAERPSAVESAALRSELDKATRAGSVAAERARLLEGQLLQAREVERALQVRVARLPELEAAVATAQTQVAALTTGAQTAGLKAEETIQNLQEEVSELRGTLGEVRAALGKAAEGHPDQMLGEAARAALAAVESGALAFPQASVVTPEGGMPTEDDIARHAAQAVATPTPASVPPPAIVPEEVPLPEPSPAAFAVVDRIPGGARLIPQDRATVAAFAQLLLDGTPTSQPVLPDVLVPGIGAAALRAAMTVAAPTPPPPAVTVTTPEPESPLATDAGGETHLAGAQPGDQDTGQALQPTGPAAARIRERARNRPAPTAPAEAPIAPAAAAAPAPAPAAPALADDDLEAVELVRGCKFFKDTVKVLLDRHPDWTTTQLLAWCVAHREEVAVIGRIPPPTLSERLTSTLGFFRPVAQA